jgi:long-chain fatty acid transport protein
MFPDGEKIRNDMPAMLSVGAGYMAGEKLGVNAGFHYYFDKSANYGKKLNGVYVDNDKVIDNNFFEVAAGLEYKLSEKLLVSGGYLLAKTGVNLDYQNDLSYSLTSSTAGLGGKYQLNDMIGIDLGFGYTIYADGEKTIDHLLPDGTTIIPAKETYYKNNILISIGVDLSF